MNKRGFTLIEVMVGIVILTVMTFLVWQISSSSLDSKDRVEKRDAVYQAARLVVERIVDDLSMAFIAGSGDLTGKMKDGAPIETAFVGEDNGALDTLSFTSFSHIRMMRNAKESEQAVINYYTDPDPERSGSWRLMRRESPYLGSDVTKGGGRAYPIAFDIKNFEFEYYDGRSGEWTKDWNSKEVDQKNLLPRAVKITVSFADPENEDEKLNFSTIGFIELWQAPIAF